MATVRDILKALDVITGGRVITDSFGYGGANPFVVTKTSGIPGNFIYNSRANFVLFSQI